MNTPLDIARIEELAEKATPGPWTFKSGVLSSTGGYVVRHGASDHSTMETFEGWKRNGPYIAALDPATVLALCAKAKRCEEAERRCKALEDELDMREQEGCLEDNAIMAAEARATAAEALADRMAEGLRTTRRHVEVSNKSDHLMDGFGPRSEQPSDAELATIDALLTEHAAAKEARR